MDSWHKDTIAAFRVKCQSLCSNQLHNQGSPKHGKMCRFCLCIFCVVYYLLPSLTLCIGWQRNFRCEPFEESLITILLGAKLFLRTLAPTLRIKPSFVELNSLVEFRCLPTQLVSHDHNIIPFCIKCQHQNKYPCLPFAHFLNRLC